MNILKHMEAVFVATIAVAVLAVSGTYAPGSVRDAQASTTIATVGSAAMPVVVVSAKRMSADEKLQSLREERKLATARDTQWNRT
jgi:hypothetical protein